MMNKKFFAVTMLAAGCLSFLTTQKNPGAVKAQFETYPMAGIITSLDEKNDLVTVSTGAGLLYDFYGAEDYAVGDIVAMTMDDNGTADFVLDDKIIAARYAGWSGALEKQNLESAMVDMSEVVRIELQDGSAHLQMKDGTGYYWER